MELLEVMQKRRSVRTYTGEAVSEEDVTCILQADFCRLPERLFGPGNLLWCGIRKL